VTVVPKVALVRVVYPFPGHGRRRGEIYLKEKICILLFQDDTPGFADFSVALV
jgi:hypothetical protein